MNSKSLLYSIILPVVFAFFVCFLMIKVILPTPKLAYVDTSKLMIGFAEAAKVEREIKAENDKLSQQLKALQDSLKIALDEMSKVYDNATVAKKRELQDLLAARNQQVNNFKAVNARKMEALRQEKLQTVVEKVNLYMSEYGKKHNYSIILGTTTGGNILFGNENGYDITKEIINGLNERYK